MPKRNFFDPSYVKWRKEVYARDKHKCRWPYCKKRTKLQVHHIRRWADAPYLRYDVNNGITLCAAHHSSIKGKENYYMRFFYEILKNGF